MINTDEFTLLNPLGNCLFGEIYLSTKKGGTEKFAIKRLRKNKYSEQGLNEVLKNELEILLELNHKNICKFYKFFQTENDYYIVLEYINGGKLSDILEIYQRKYHTPFSEQIVQHLMNQIIDAFKYIHSNKILHRNINLDNIMVHFDNDKDKNDLNLLKARIKIIGFCFAIRGESGKVILGNPLTMDPLLLINLKNPTDKDNIYDNKIDIWSIGVVCYEMLTGKILYNAQSLNDLVEKSQNGFYTIPKKLSFEAYSFLNSLLRFSSTERLSAEQLSNQPFLKKKVQDFKPIDINNFPKITNVEAIKKGLNFNENEELLLSTKIQSQIPTSPNNLNAPKSYVPYPPNTNTTIISQNSISNPNNLQLNAGFKNPNNFGLPQYNLNGMNNSIIIQQTPYRPSFYGTKNGKLYNIQNNLGQVTYYNKK